MPEPREYPSGVPCWIDLEVSDTEAAHRFYGGLLGWEFDDGWQAGGATPYFVARLGGAEVAGVGTRTVASGTTAWNTYVRVDDLETTLAKVRSAGGDVVDASDRLPSLAAVATITDPAGTQLRLWQPRSLSGVQAANAPGSWNMNELSTTDPERAQAFYAATFGWEFNSMSFGEERSWMVRMPGYGDFLTRYDPNIRERQAEAGVPSGFEDAIAWMSEPSDGSAEEPARWGIIFAIADPDATAKRAVELGGSIVMEPMDVGPDVRLAVLADPFGAAFTVNRYGPAIETA